jgi:hypothetical protein
MTRLVERLRNIAAAKSRPMDRASCIETEAADMLERRDEILRAVLYYADNPMTGVSLQLVCDDIRRLISGISGVEK